MSHSTLLVDLSNSIQEVFEIVGNLPVLTNRLDAGQQMEHKIEETSELPLF